MTKMILNNDPMLKKKLCWTAVMLAFATPVLSNQLLVHQNIEHKFVDNVFNLNNGSSERQNEGFFEDSYIDLTSGLIEHDKLKTSTLRVWGGVLRIPTQIRMHEYQYLEHQGGTIESSYIDAKKTKGSGTRTYGDMYVSTLAFVHGELVFDKMDVYIETKQINYWTDYDPRAWGPEFHEGASFRKFSGVGNPLVNVIGVISDRDEAIGTTIQYRGNSSREDIDLDFHIKNVQGRYKSAIGLYLKQYGGSPLQNNINGEIDISDIRVVDSRNESFAYGIHNKNSGTTNFNKNVSIKNINIEKGEAYGIKNGANGTMKFHAGLQIDHGLVESVENSSTNKCSRAAIYNSHQVLILGNEDTLNAINGDIINERYLSAEFTNKNSYFNGAIIQKKNSSLEYGPSTYLTFKNGGNWFVTKDSKLHELRVIDSGLIDLTRIDPEKKRNVHIQVDTLKSTNGIANVHLDLKKQNSGSLIKAGDASGTFNIILAIDNLTESFKKSDVPLIEIYENNKDSGSFSAEILSYKPGAAQKLELQFFEAGSNSIEGKKTSNSNGGWYLVNPNFKPIVPPDPGENPQPNPDKPTPDQGGQTKPPVTDEVDQVLSLGTSLTQAVGMLSETEDLRMRMGDVRHGDTDGLWVRTYSRKDTARGSFGNGFEQDVHGFHIGADHVIRSNDNASWLVGGAFHYGKSDIEGAAEAGGGDADIDQYTFKAYATYMKDNGAFADIVLHTGYYDTTLTGKDNTGLGSFKGDYSNWGYGVSAEVGHRFDLTNIANRWYIEPTAQLTWFHAEGKNFKTSTGLEINQGDADFITGRLGAAVGKVFALGAADDPMSSYFSVAMKGGMLYQFDGDQTITAHGTDGATVVCADAMDMKGARAYYGINADWKIDDTWRVYGQISREEGSGYTKDYDASIGVRYAF